MKKQRFESVTMTYRELLKKLGIKGKLREAHTSGEVVYAQEAKIHIEYEIEDVLTHKPKKQSGGKNEKKNNN